jgi:hypothetical protein
MGRPASSEGSGRVPREAAGPSLRGWSGHYHNGSGAVTARCRGERPGGLGDPVDGADRKVKQPVRDVLRELAQLPSVRADVDAGHFDAALRAGRI